jgi:hypothetical protein
MSEFSGEEPGDVARDTGGEAPDQSRLRHALCSWNIGKVPFHEPKTASANKAADIVNLRPESRIRMRANSQRRVRDLPVAYRANGP